MALLSPEANLLKGTIKLINDEVPEIRYISQDIGQLENYEIRPSVSWPCTLIDIEDGVFSDTADQNIQIAQKIVSIRLGLVKYSDVNNLSPEAVKDAGLQYLELEHKIYSKLHGKAVQGFGKFIRIADGTEKRDDDIRVRFVKFGVVYTDDSAKPVRTKVARPDASVIA